MENAAVTQNLKSWNLGVIGFHLVVALAIVLPMRGFAGERPEGIEDWRRVVKDAGQANAHEKYATVDGTFEIPSDFPGSPYLTCHYSTAIDGPKHAAPRAQQIVYYFHHPGEVDFQKGDMFRSLAEECGFTVFGVWFDRQNQTPFSQRTRYYAFAQSGSFKAIRQAYEQLRTRFPFTRPGMFLYGYSAGSIGVQRFTEEYPDICMGAVLGAGHSFVQKNGATCPLLLLVPFADLGLPQCESLAALCTHRERPALLVQLPAVSGLRRDDNGFYMHGLHPLSRPLALRYLEGIADLRTANGNGAVPPMERWPYVVAAADSRWVMSTAKPGWKDRMVATGNSPIAIPSAPFLRALTFVPPPLQRTESAIGPLIIAQPASQTNPVGILLVRDRPQQPELQADHLGEAEPTIGRPVPDQIRLEEDLHFAAEQGHITVAALRTGKEWLPLLRQAQRPDAKSAKLPVTAIHFNPDPAELAAVGQIPGLRGVILVMSLTAEIDPLRPTLQRFDAARIRYQIVVPAETKAQASGLLSLWGIAANSPVMKIIIGHGLGESETAGLRQAIMDAVIAFATEPDKKR